METHSAILTRIRMGFQVNPQALQPLPSPWQVAQSPEDALRGANLIALFNGILLYQPVEGVPFDDRRVGLGIRATNPQTTESGAIQFRMFASNPRSIPRTSSVAVLADIRHEHVLKSAGLETTACEHFEVQAAGGVIDFRLQYRRQVASFKRRSWST